MTQFSCDISLSDAAIAQFRKVLNEQNRKAVRLSLRKSGCSGYEYLIDYADTAEPGDVSCPFEGFTFYVDGEAYELALKGLCIDFQQDLLSSSFVYNNPNQKGECGCGISFTIM